MRLDELRHGRPGRDPVGVRLILALLERGGRGGAGGQSEKGQALQGSPEKAHSRGRSWNRRRESWQRIRGARYSQTHARCLLGKQHGVRTFASTAQEAHDGARAAFKNGFPPSAQTGPVEFVRFFILRFRRVVLAKSRDPEVVVLRRGRIGCKLLCSVSGSRQRRALRASTANTST